MNDESLTPACLPTGAANEGGFESAWQATDPAHERRTPKRESDRLSGIAAGSASITPEMLAFVQLDQQHIDTIVRTVPGGAENIHDIYPLSPLQDGMLFHRLLNQHNDTYVLSALLELRSRAQLDDLVRALQAVIDRHDVLRTAVLWEELPQSVQVVYRQAVLQVEELTLDGGRDAILQLKELMRPEQQRFDLRRAPLLKLQLASDTRAERCYALLAVHHVICDYESLNLILEEVAACLRGCERELPATTAYRAYVAQSLQRDEARQDEAYFRDKLGDLDEPTESFGLFDARGDGSQMQEARRSLEAGLAGRVRTQARRTGVSPARLMHAAWTLVVAGISGRDDVVFGTVLLAARHHNAQQQRMLGMCVNTLPLRLNLQGVTASGLVEQTHRELMRLREHENASLTLALRSSGIAGTGNLFTALLNYRHAVADPAAQADGSAAIRVLERGESWTNYPVTLIVDDLAEGFALTAQTCRAIDPQRVIDYLQTALASLLNALDQAPQTPALALTILPANEWQQVLGLLNRPREGYPRTLIHEQFERQARRIPHSVAVSFEGQSLTYAELNSKANQVARYLRHKGVDADELVGICLERCLEMAVGLLGILKAGGAYVPLDPHHPADRLEHMLKDAAPRVVLTQQDLRTVLPDTTAQVIALDADWSEIARHSPENLEADAPKLSARNLAYVIYTSGSTGKPKGVLVEHGNVTRLFAATEQWFGFNERDVWSLFHSFGFDFSVWELWGALLYGGRVVIVPYLTARSAQDFYQLVCAEGVTVLNQTPSAFAQLIEAQGQSETQRHSLRLVIFGGEALELRSLRPWVMRNGATVPQLVNMYGITETTVHVTYRPPLTKEEIETERASLIGRPIPDLYVYLLNQHGLPAPIGVAGEIYVGGAGVARGYLNRPELTSARFVRDPFSSDPQARLYRSGDLGRWRADGSLEYLGRNDHQVKIRGFRIELGEIEAQLARHALVNEAIVVAREDIPGEKRLVAYVIAKAGTNAVPDAEGLRTHLGSVLPEYMVPSAFVMLDRLPLTANGKLDRRALPAPDVRAYVTRQYEAPQGELEQALAAIWQELLRVERVGRQDNFFELGGHSLLIVQMLGRLRRLGLSAEVRNVFESPSLAGLASCLHTGLARPVAPPNLIPLGCDMITPDMLPLIELDAADIARIVQSVPGGAANIQDIYPLASLQEGILFHHLLAARGGDTYVVPTVLQVSSRERLQELIEALQRVIDRHDVLRTAVLWEQLPRPVQVVYRRATLPVEELPLDPGRDPQEQMRERIRPERQRMDLRLAPLLRLQASEDPVSGQWYVLLQLHHIIGDNTSQEIVTAEVVARLEGRAQRLQESLPYRNHVAQSLAYARTHDAESFFRSKLSDVDEPTAPFGLLDVRSDGSRVEEAGAELDPALAQRIRAQARRLAVSAATLFHAAWALVIAGTSGRDDVVFGSVLLGRLQGEIGAQTGLGMFINTLPLRVRLRGETAEGLVKHVHRELAALLEHEQASLTLAQRCSAVAGSEALFSTLLNYRHRAPNPDSEWSGARGIRVLATQDRTNYPIVFSVDDLGDGFALTAQTDQRIGPQRITGYLRRALETLADALDGAQQAPALSLSILPESERREVIEGFNATHAPYPRSKSVHQLFEEQAQRTPDAPAATYLGQSLTYRELNGKANQLAWYLRDQSVLAGDYVPLRMSRSLDMLIAQIAVLKCGGVYVPIDPDLPIERCAFMIRDCGARLVLVDDTRLASCPGTTVRWVDCTALSGDIGALPDRNLLLPLGPAPAAYVMYTSGSTGIPKGVIVPHHALNRLAINNGYARIMATDCIPHYSNPAFDASTFEVWGALLNGARVLVVPQAVVLEAQRFAELLLQEQVTLLWMTVGLFNQYTTALAQVFARLRYLIVGGDRVEPGAVRRVLLDSPPQVLLNAYGPTECTTFSTTYVIGGVDAAAHGIPIGRPISNAQVYILDERQQPVPIGVTGEMYIGGAGVAKGYLNRPELTAQRFVPDPFSGEPQARMYRTGDLGRWQADGTIEFLGRTDHQVKIRGLRIELGEIEAQLVRHERINDATVVVWEEIPGDKRLVAYLVPSDPSAELPAPEELRAHLKIMLPDYMVPSVFVSLDSMPLTANGKVDRRALPAPQLGAYAKREYEAPQGHVEEVLAGIWQSLLQLERIGRQDNFFELGGHSLLIVQMMEHLRRVGLSTEVRRVFDSPRLADLASAIASEKVEQFVAPPNLIPAECATITPQMLPLLNLDSGHIERIVATVPGGAANVQDIYPLAPLQEGILFHHLLDDRGDTYVLPTILRVPTRERLDELIAALQGVIDRHDVLRTAVLWDQLPQPVQVVYRRAALPVEEVVLGQDPTTEIADWIRPERQRLDLIRAPLMRLQAAVHPGTDQWYVLLQLHHLTIDHVGLEIVISEVAALLEGRAHELPTPIPYRNHVAQALAYDRTQEAEQFFHRKLADVSEPTTPFGLQDVFRDGRQIVHAHQDLDSSLAARVRGVARRRGISAATLFHAAWGLVIAHTSGQHDIVFGSVLLGRLQGSAGAQQTLGLFVNTLPLRLRLSGLTAEALVEQTHRELVELLNHEQASLAVAQRCSAIAGSAPLFSALFNYRHSAPNPGSSWSGVRGVEVLAVQDWTNYPMTMSVDDLGEGFSLKAQMDYRIDPQRMCAYLQCAVRSLIEALESEGAGQVLTLPIIPDSERELLIERFNATRFDGPRDKQVHQLFEAQVGRTPQAVAVMYQGQSLTYEAVNSAANQLARSLRSCGVGPNQRVGVCVERSIGMVVAVLAVLKAGGAYLPLDPNYPTERLRYMLEDAAPLVVIAQGELQPGLSAAPAKLIDLDATLKEVAQFPVQDLQEPGSAPNDPVYVIYTSGSTGRPKGAVMEHRSMVNLLEWHRRELPLEEDRRVLQFAALSFDVAFQEIFSTLCGGGTLVLIDEWQRRDARELLKALSRENINRLFVPPLMLQSIAECARATSADLTNLRDVITAGEQLRITPEIVTLFEQLRDCRLHNHYGPTETHVVTTLSLTGHPAGWPTLPAIGRPISNAQVYLLDSRRQPVPLGIAGEIYLGGACVARGYLNRPELTEQRFLADPFSASPQARMYKTGDLGRWREDGVLEYLGRNDGQVKIRGYRIELGEIEALLAQDERVREAAVGVREDIASEKRLVAYVTPMDGNAPPRAEDLRTALKASLPEYMVPAAFVVLERLPTTPSGKLDRRALPAPELDACLGRRYEAPYGEVEEMLAGIWQQLLRVDRIGRQDDFFELGGHSLLATRVMSRVRELLNVEIPIRAIFDAPTLEQLAVRIGSEQRRQHEVEAHQTDHLARHLRDEIGEMSDEAVLARIAALESELGTAAGQRF